MQEIVNFLIQNPEVDEKVLAGKASLLGLSADDLEVVKDSIMVLGGREGGGGYWY